MRGATQVGSRRPAARGIAAPRPRDGEQRSWRRLVLRRSPWVALALAAGAAAIVAGESALVVVCMTILALAMRSSEYLAEQMRQGNV